MNGAAGSSSLPAALFAHGSPASSSPDPLWGDPAELSLNRYTYAQDDPITLWDPTALYVVGVDDAVGDCGRACQAALEAGEDTAGTSPPEPPPTPAPAWWVPLAKLLSGLAGAAGAIGEAAGSVAEKASLAGRLLRTGTAAERSWARKWLPRLGAGPVDDLARSPWGRWLVKGARVFGAASGLLTFAADYEETASEPGTSTAEGLIHAGVVTAGGVAGGVAGPMLCGLLGVPTGGLAAGACLVLGGIGGSFAGEWIGDWIGDASIADRPGCAGSVVPAGRGGWICRG